MKQTNNTNTQIQDSSRKERVNKLKKKPRDRTQQQMARHH